MKFVASVSFLLLTGALLSAYDNHQSGQEETVALEALGLPTNPPYLLEFLRLRSQPAVPQERLNALFAELEDPQAAVRNRASSQLIPLGPLAVPGLRQLSKEVDKPLLARTAQNCLTAIESLSSLTGSVLNLILLHPTDEALPVLLEFLPYSEEEGVLDETRRVLLQLGVREGKLHPELLRVLENAQPICRNVALDILCQLNGRASLPLLRKYLKDPQLTLRLRTTLALARRGEGEAIPLLIDLLEHLSIEQGKQVEEFLIELAGDTAPKVSLAADQDSRKKCSRAWLDWWQNPPAAISSPNLLQELRRRTIQEVDRDKILEIIKLLGDENFAIREKASGDLRAIGEVALPLLRDSAALKDPEISRRSEDLLREFEKDRLPALPASVLRLLNLRRPEGYLKDLLIYYPFADGDSAQEEAQQALNLLASHEEKVNPLLVRAAEDRLPLRRQCAGVALTHCPDPQATTLARKLLQDRDVQVRVPVSLALASQHRDKQAIGVLIAGLPDLSERQAVDVEEYLRWLSSGNPLPDLPANADLKKRRDYWQAWWTAQGPGLQITERPSLLPAQNLGYTLLISYNNNQIHEYDATGKLRWTLNDVGNPMDAQVLPGERVLVAEFAANRVTERNLKGEILWQRAVPSNPMSAQRLANGHTLIIMRNQLLEVDRAGKEISHIDRPQSDVFSARRLSDGKTVVISSTDGCIKLDRTGKVLSKFAIPGGLSQFANHITPAGGVIVPNTWQNTLTEYRPDGKQARNLTIQQPTCGCPLPNGNLLVGLNGNPSRVLEFDAKGKNLGEFKANLNFMVTRINRR